MVNLLNHTLYRAQIEINLNEGANLIERQGCKATGPIKSSQLSGGFLLYLKGGMFSLKIITRIIINNKKRRNLYVNISQSQDCH